MTSEPWTITEGDGPVVAVSIHSGHHVRGELVDLLAIDDAKRLREEDPFTDQWTAFAPTRVNVHRSRFEVDLNRPREGAVYVRPEQAWGLQVWKSPPAQEVIDRSLAIHDAFYAEMRSLLDRVADRHGRFLVYDLHSYNHRRDGPAGPAADPEHNPEVNLGTGTMDRDHWASVVDRFLRDLSAQDFLGRRLDVRENVKFQGGQLSRWVHATYPKVGCSLAVEFKKIFMDEWTGDPFPDQMMAIRQALAATVPGVLETLQASP